MNKIILFFVIFLFILVSCTLAGPPVEKTPQLAENVEAFGDYTPVEILGDLQFHQDLWMEANLSGDSKRAGNYLATVMALLSYDISVASYEVSELARQALLAPQAESPDPSVLSAEHEAFSRGVAVLNFKEKLFKSITSTDAFSNKYRLIGDYLQLLRHELDRPGAKMAVTDGERSNHDAGAAARSEN